MSDKPDFASLIGSRICHDLISPIGAIGNGVELMLMEGAQNSPEMALVSESVANANAKIRFFRLAFGAASGEAAIGRAEVAAILADITRGTRLRIDLTLQDRLPRASIKLSLLLVMCLETALPFGGTIAIDQGDERWIITGKADRLKIDPDLWAMLTDGISLDLRPAHVQFALVAEELNRQHRRLTTAITKSEVKFTF
jgi:histidine phosphotransferase ChpT